MSSLRQAGKTRQAEESHASSHSEAWSCLRSPAFTDVLALLHVQIVLENWVPTC